MKQVSPTFRFSNSSYTNPRKLQVSSLPGGSSLIALVRLLLHIHTGVALVQHVTSLKEMGQKQRQKENSVHTGYWNSLPDLSLTKQQQQQQQNKNQKNS